MYRKFFRRYRYLIAVSAIVLVGAVLRFYNFPHTYTLNGDAVRDAIVAQEGARSLSFPLIGPFSSTGPYTFGPWYYIGLIFGSVVLPVPFAPWIFMGLTSLITIVLMYHIGALLHSKKLGLLLAGLTALVPSEVAVGTGLSNINPVPLFATLSIWLVLRIMKMRHVHPVWYIVLGLSLGFGINAHYQMLGLLVLPVLLWLYKGWRKFAIPLYIFFGLFLTFIPLLLFNLQTDWHTLRGMHEMYLSKSRIYVPNSWKIYLFEFWPAVITFLFKTPIVLTILLIASTGASFVYSLLRKTVKVEMFLLLGVLIFNAVSLRFYWGQRTEVYLYYLEPFIIVFVGYFLFRLWQYTYTKVVTSCLLVAIGIFMLVADVERLQRNPDRESFKEAETLSVRYGETPIVFYACNRMNDHYVQGLGYLMDTLDEQGGAHKKIAHETICLYPPVPPGGADRKIVYPRLTKSGLYDFSAASESGLKEASWSAVTRRAIYDKTVNWWKR